jgi:hypothetical protein
MQKGWKQTMPAPRGQKQTAPCCRGWKRFGKANGMGGGALNSGYKQAIAMANRQGGAPPSAHGFKATDKPLGT